MKRPKPELINRRASSEMTMMRILFVCLGNICRSPTAEAVFKYRAKKAGLDVFVDSAGTIATHSGEQPDARSMRAGIRRGYDFSGQFSRKVKQTDFLEFDLIFAMDKSNLHDLLSICPPEQQHKLSLFLSLIEVDDPQVPDPYYGGERGFEHVLDLIERASDALIFELNNRKR